jgi:cold shock CspA family protein
MKFGHVKLFKEDGGFGFLVVSDGERDIFFHVNDHSAQDNSFCRPSRTPQRGDRLAFKIHRQNDGRVCACPWTFASEIPVRVAESGCTTVNLHDVPTLDRYRILDGDVSVHSIESRGNAGHGPRINWICIVHRPSTGELFQVQCWDGERGGFTPQIPSVSLPGGLTVTTKVHVVPMSCRSVSERHTVERGGGLYSGGYVNSDYHDSHGDDDVFWRRRY